MMNVHNIFTPHDLWWGGFYELAIELGDAGDSKKLACALAEVWGQACITGPFERNDIEPSEQKTTHALPEQRHYYGVIECAPLQSVCCGTCVIQEDVDPGGSSWLLLYIPFGALHQVIPYSSEFIVAHENFLPIIETFRAIALNVYRTCGFELALIGHEISGDFYAQTLNAHDIPCPYCGFLVPQNHPVTHSIQGNNRDEQLIWYRPNERDL